MPNFFGHYQSLPNHDQLLLNMTKAVLKGDSYCGKSFF
nr:MAG TPA: AAA ATPase [Caudoviricetes sp.]